MQGDFNHNYCELSVIVPVSNMAGRLESFFNWIVHASDFPMEVIVVHDKHDNATGKELRELLNLIANPKIFLLEGNYNGPGGARNAGLELASAEWISFWDSDDSINLEQVFSNLRSEAVFSADIIIGGFTVLDQKYGKATQQGISLEKSKALMEVALNPGLWRMQFRKNMVKSIRFQELYMGEDQLFLIDLQIWSKRIVFMSNSGYTYHKNRPGQLTLNRTKVNELILATKVLTGQFFRFPSNLKLYDLTILVRQILTNLVHAKIRVKIEAIRILLRMSFNAILSRDNSFFRAIYIVLRYRIKI
jgi:glycosyltransferase involved in cell wall biosynthesis